MVSYILTFVFSRWVSFVLSLWVFLMYFCLLLCFFLEKIIFCGFFIAFFVLVLVVSM